MMMFWERGYQGASIADLTAAMGINAPSLYAAFGSKEELFREAVARYDALEKTASERALHEATTPREAVERMLRGNADNYTDPDKPSGCLIVLGGAPWSDDDAAVSAYLAGLRHGTSAALRARFARDAASGDLPPDADLDALASYVNTVLEGLSIQARDGASRATLHTVIDCVVAGWDACVAASRRPGE